MKRLLRIATLLLLCFGMCSTSYAAETSVIWQMNNQPAIPLGVNQTYADNSNNNYPHLKVPTQMTRQGDYYFIVDTYNHQVIYTKDMYKPINEWKVMDRIFNLPHAIASDGVVYLVADTDNNRVLCYEHINGRFQNTQKFDDMGIRPHYIQYDAATESFFVWSSLTGDMYIIKRNPETNVLYIKEVRHIYELANHYVRSFNIEGDEVIFPSGSNGYIIVADKDTLRVKKRYTVTPEISGMAFAKKIGNFYYLTVSTDEKYSHDSARMIRTADLNTLSVGQYENITPLFTGMKVPYYIDQINGSYYVTNHNSGNFVYKFDVVDDAILNINIVR